MPILIQVCIVVLTLMVVVGTVALVRVLAQLRKTAAQAEATLRTVDATLPRLEQTLAQADEVLASVRNVVVHAERIAGDVSHVGSKAVKFSSLFVDQVAGPTARAAALISGVRTGAMFLVDGWRRHRAQKSQSTGGNHHE